MPVYGPNVWTSTGLNSIPGVQWVEPVAGQMTCALAAGEQSRLLLARGFNFTVPGDAKINGYLVEITRHLESVTDDGAVRDDIVQLMLASGARGVNKATASPWAEASTKVSFGSALDGWNSLFFPAQVNNFNFGVGIQVTNTGATGGVMASLDLVEVTVYFSNGFSQKRVARPALGGGYLG